MKLLRRLYWHLIKVKIFEATRTKTGPLAYPLSIWIAFEGKDIYINNGYDIFVTKLMAEFDRVKEVIEDAFRPEHLKPVEKRRFSISQNIKRMQEIRRQAREEHEELLSRADLMDIDLDSARFDADGHADLPMEKHYR